MRVRVFLFDPPRPGAVSVAATLHAELAGAREDQPDPREILLDVDTPDPAATFAHAMAVLERLQPCWRDLAQVDRIA